MSALLARWRRGAAADDPTPPVRSAARTHVGRVRRINEDRVLDRADRGLWAVADGMGGHSGGDAAAQAAIDALEGLADAAAPIRAAMVEASLLAAHHRIETASAEARASSGTTIVVLHLAGTRATIAWAGDSRCYLVRTDTVRQLTRDHSVVQELIDAGLVAPADAARHPSGHVITRALGVAPFDGLETVTIEIEPGDRLLLCSDGMSRSLADRDLLVREPVDAYADRLLTAALQRDGADNISLVVVDVAPN